jgi:hypothetical protein
MYGLTSSQNLPVQYSLPEQKTPQSQYRPLPHTPAVQYDESPDYRLREERSPTYSSQSDEIQYNPSNTAPTHSLPIVKLTIQQWPNDYYYQQLSDSRVASEQDGKFQHKMLNNENQPTREKRKLPPALGSYLPPTLYERVRREPAAPQMLPPLLSTAMPPLMGERPEEIIRSQPSLASPKIGRYQKTNLKLKYTVYMT